MCFFHFPDSFTNWKFIYLEHCLSSATMFTSSSFLWDTWHDTLQDTSRKININTNVNRYLPHCFHILLGSKPLGTGTVAGHSLLSMSHSWWVWNSSACTTLCTRCSSPFQQMWESIFCLKSCSSLKSICSSVSDMHLCHCRNWNKTKGSLKE